MKQFPGYSNTTSTPLSLSTLKSGGSYNANLAKVYRQWVDLCTFTPTQAGDYYIQVRTTSPCRRATRWTRPAPRSAT